MISLSNNNTFVRFVLRVVVPIFVSSCVNHLEEPEFLEPSNVRTPFEITVGTSQTKVSVSESLQMRWEDGDCIILFHAPSGTKEYVYDGYFTALGEGNEVKFIGYLAEELTAPSYDWYAFTNDGILEGESYDYYHISSPEECRSSVGVQYTFGSSSRELWNCIKLFPLAGIVKGLSSKDELHIEMREISSLLKFDVTNGTSETITIKEIDFLAQASISGSYMIDITTYPAKYGEIVFSYAFGDQIAQAHSTTEIPSGETVSFYTNVRPFVAEKNSRITMKVLAVNNGWQEKILSLSDSGLSFEAGTVNTMRFTFTKEVSDSPIIEFKDWRVEQICVDNFDSNLDGKLSYEEAAEVREIPDRFFPSYMNYADKISSFDELQYFTSLEKIGSDAFRSKSIKSIILPDGIKDIGEAAFFWCTSLENLTIPESLQTIGANAFCYSGLNGDIVIPDGVSVIKSGTFSNTNISSVLFNDNLKEISINAFQGCSKLRTITFGSYLNTIGEGAFADCPLLEEVGSFPESLTSIGLNPFSRDYNIRSFSGKGATSDGRFWILSDCLLSVACDGNPSMTFQIPKDVKSIGGLAFAGMTFNRIDLPESLETIGIDAFMDCISLQDMSIPNTVVRIEPGAFYNCSSLSDIIIPPSVTFLGGNSFGNTSSNVVYIKNYLPPASDNYTIIFVDSRVNRIYVPTESIDIYKAYWPELKGLLFPYKFEDLEEPGEFFYMSTDYSHDGEVSLLQRAAEGNGIDIVMMGDHFSDRQIANGTYSAVLEKAIDLFFEEEPYKSFRRLFNIYVVNVVSPLEYYRNDAPGNDGALHTWFGDGTSVGGNADIVDRYAQKAIPKDRMDEALIIVIMNRNYYAGTCYMSIPNESNGDFGSGHSISYFPLGLTDSGIGPLILHEAGGHGFAKLADEYFYTEAISPEERAEMKKLEKFGWWKNVDFTNDAKLVKWSVFLQDVRYESEELGIYEGGAMYRYGVYRPTFNSIMRYNTGGYNAPSRLAIWYRIHKLAYGDTWTGSYEDFVQYDAINRSSAAHTAMRRMKSRFDSTLPPLAPPVIIRE